jgi:rhodanese-related sulfurtransferase
MRKGWMIACGFVLVCGLAASATPRISVAQPDYDFGSIGQGYMVKHTFTLQNTGDRTLNIVYVRASCGCTTTALGTQQLAPGESVPLEVQVVADHGTTKNVTIYIYTNAPDIHGTSNDDRKDPDIQLHVHGAITPAMQDYETAPFELYDRLLLLIDVRTAADYAANHLIGAINIPASRIATGISELPKDTLLLVYDLNGELADAAVQALLNAGYMSSYYLQGGLRHWVAVQGDRYLVHASPLPPSGGDVSGGASGRPWNQGTLNSDFYILIDVRDGSAYAAGHIPGAFNIPVSQLSQWFGRIPHEARIYLYDDDETLTSAARQTLINAGFSDDRVTVLLGGLNEWIYQYGTRYLLSE